MSLYSPETVNRIIHRISQGRSLASTCKEIGIDDSTVYNWLKDPDKKEFFDKYARARDIQADYYADEVIEIADNETIPTDSRRVRIDARKWHAGKQRPKKYGDKVQTEISGQVTITKIERVIVNPSDSNSTSLSSVTKTSEI